MFKVDVCMNETANSSGGNTYSSPFCEIFRISGIFDDSPALTWYYKLKIFLVQIFYLGRVEQDGLPRLKMGVIICGRNARYARARRSSCDFVHRYGVAEFFRRSGENSKYR
jgi:hypothetical protein